MKKVHLVIADLFLPSDFAAEVCAGLHLPALEKILARGASIQPLVLSAVEGAARTDDSRLSLEQALCGLFSVPRQSGIAPISAEFDGLGDGFWLRADPVHVRLQREQVVLLPNVTVSADESAQLCASLNEHFAGQGMEFFAPHPSRWYVRLVELTEIITVPLSQAAGRNIHGNLPAGTDARRWHQLFNEIQMLLFAHPLNEAREARGEVTINSVWFWGNGEGAAPAPAPAQCDYGSASSDEVLVEMLAASAGILFDSWQPAWRSTEGRQLLVWTGLRSALQRGDLAGWRSALQQFETGYAQPLWQALRKGQISQLQVDILGGDSLRQIRLARGDAWAFWRRSQPLAYYSAESKNNE
ncbi:MAG: hypothetical protein WC208_10295 [Gallionella sp.]|jgi:hypothetical protein